MAATLEEESKTWSTLPQDILLLIFEKLYLVDRIRFPAVCKEWFSSSIQFRKVILIHSIRKQLPWISYYSSGYPTAVCKTWSTLPQDILLLIFEKLYLVDRIRFPAVCKEWFSSSIQFRKVILIHPIRKQLPWIMEFSIYKV